MGQVFVRASRRAKAYTRAKGVLKKIRNQTAGKAHLLSNKRLSSLAKRAGVAKEIIRLHNKKAGVGGFRGF